VRGTSKIIRGRPDGSSQRVRTSMALSQTICKEVIDMLLVMELGSLKSPRSLRTGPITSLAMEGVVWRPQVGLSVGRRLRALLRSNHGLPRPLAASIIAAAVSQRSPPARVKLRPSTASPGLRHCKSDDTPCRRAYASDTPRGGRPHACREGPAAADNFFHVSPVRCASGGTPCGLTGLM
jgi:hypothetical protein